MTKHLLIDLPPHPSGVARLQALPGLRLTFTGPETKARELPADLLARFTACCARCRRATSTT